MENKIELGLIGLGLWGQNYLRLIREDIRLNLRGCADLGISKLRFGLNDRFPNINTSSDYRTLLNDKMIQGIIIVTPSKDHYAVAKDCLSAGKHVLVEKPMALTSEQCRELDSLAKEKGLILMVGHIFLFNPAVRKVKELIDSDEIGRLLYFYSVRTGLGPVRNDVNALWDLAPHDLSIALHWIKSKPISVSARGACYLNGGLQDVVFMNVKFENNEMANIHVSWLDSQKTRKITLVGDKKMIIFDDVSIQEKIRICDKGVGYQQAGATFGEFQALIRDGDIVIPKIPNSEPLKEELGHFADCILNGKQPITDGNNGTEVVRILEAAQHSLDEATIIHL